MINTYKEFKFHVWLGHDADMLWEMLDNGGIRPYKRILWALRLKLGEIF